MLIDLHVHSRYSDGEFYPGELIPFVKEHGVSVVSITDHDTISGLDQAVKAGKEYGIAVIPGVELTTYFENVEVHILGYDIDYKNKKFLKIINNLRDKRFLRVKRMLAKLRQEGVDIHDKDIFKAEDIISGEVRMSYGRPHIAKVLYEKGFVKSFQHAFERYIGNDCKACLPKESFPTLEGIRLIKEVGGTVVCAHPEDLDGRYLDIFQENGLDGLEVYCPAHDEMQVYHYEILVRDRNLIATSGSDMHGERGYSVKLGRLPKDDSFIEKMGNIFPAVQALL